MKELSKRQREVLRQIGHFWQEAAFPVVRELAEAMGLAGESSLTPTLHRLQIMGLVQIQGGVRGKPRVITLTRSGKAANGLGLPILGSIPAGPLARNDGTLPTIGPKAPAIYCRRVPAIFCCACRAIR